MRTNFGAINTGTGAYLFAWFGPFQRGDIIKALRVHADNQAANGLLTLALAGFRARGAYVAGAIAGPEAAAFAGGRQIIESRDVQDGSPVFRIRTDVGNNGRDFEVPLNRVIHDNFWLGVQMNATTSSFDVSLHVEMLKGSTDL
jgi:hypothetical protein